MDKTIGDRIREKRLLRKMSMQALTEAIGKSKGNICGYEKGDYEPSAQTIGAIARDFGISTDWLLTGVEYHNHNDEPEVKVQANSKNDETVWVT